jgi:hypothetical protein
MPSKTERLGMGEGPMSATTLSVQGLTPDDAVEIVRRKIQRALRANASSFKVLFLPENGKLQRKIEGYLSTVGSVREFFIDTDHPGTLWIHF